MPAGRGLCPASEKTPRPLHQVNPAYMPRDELDHAVRDAKRTRIEAEEAAEAAKKQQHELERKLDAYAVKEAWGKARPWCEAHGLGDFYAWADRRGVVYERAHADNSYEWSIFTRGCALDMNCGFGDLAKLCVGKTCVTVHCASRLSPVELRVDGQAFLRTRDDGLEGVGSVSLDADAAELVARASPLQLADLMARMAIVPFSPSREEARRPPYVTDLTHEIPVLHYSWPPGAALYEAWLKELIERWAAEDLAQVAEKVE